MHLKKYAPLYLICLVFSMPVLSAMLALQFKDNLIEHTMANGQFITQPPNDLNINHLKLTKNKWNLIMLTGISCDELCHSFKSELEKMHTLLRADKDRVVLSVQSMPTNSATQVLLSDPNGNLILQYTEQDNLQGILKDLMRLLKYSHV